MVQTSELSFRSEPNERRLGAMVEISTIKIKKEKKK
jgi:hypothetical protein